MITTQEALTNAEGTIRALISRLEMTDSTVIKLQQQVKALEDEILNLAGKIVEKDSRIKELKDCLKDREALDTIRETLT